MKQRVWIAFQKVEACWQIIAVFDTEDAARNEAAHYSERLGVDTMVSRHAVEHAR